MDYFSSSPLTFQVRHYVSDRGSRERFDLYIPPQDTEGEEGEREREEEGERSDLVPDVTSSLSPESAYQVPFPSSLRASSSNFSSAFEGGGGFSGFEDAYSFENFPRTVRGTRHSNMRRHSSNSDYKENEEERGERERAWRERRERERERRWGGWGVTFVGLFFGSVILSSFFPMLFLYCVEKDWVSGPWGSYSFFGFVVALSLFVPVVGMPIFQLFARKINLNWVLLFIALTSVLGNCLMIIDNRYVFLFGYAISKVPSAMRDLLLDLISLYYPSSQWGAFGVICVCLVASIVAIIFPISAYYLQTNELLDNSETLNQFTIVPIANIIMGVISGALFWISPILKEKVENENNDVEDPFDDEIRVLPHLRGLAAKEFVAKTRQRRKILASHHFFYILFFAFQLFCVSCTVGVTLVIIQPIFVQLFEFDVVGVSAAVAFTTFIYYIPLLFSLSSLTRSFFSSRVFLILSQICIVMGTFGMIFPHTSSTYCLHSIPKDTGMWLVQFFGSYCITLLGQALYSTHASKLYRELMSHLIIDPSDFPFLLKNDNSYFYLRLIPTLGPIVGALIGANFGLQKFGCSYFILFLLAPSVIGLVAFLVCFRFLKPFGLLKGIGFVDGIRRKYGKGDATVGRTLVMDSIATIRESHRVVDEYQPIESNQESLRENSITTSLAPPPSRTPSPGQETELETMSDEPFVQYYER